MSKLFPLVSAILFILVVIILGFITPGYNHLSHTISRLAIMEYGWIQTINLVQFAYGMYLGGIHISQTMSTENGKQVIHNVFFFCAGILLLTAATKTDPIENLQLDPSLLSPMGIMHYTVIFIFLIASPVGIRYLSTTLINEHGYRHFVSYTRIAGFTSLAASVLWFVLFYFGILLPYRGLSQKLIVLWTIMWIIFMNVRALRLRVKDVSRTQL